MFKRSALWYPVPFIKGHKYAATKKIIGNFETIESGTMLTYQSTGHSSYDGYIGFFFVDAKGERHRWDIYDSLDPISEYEKVFIKVQDSK